MILNEEATWPKEVRDFFKKKGQPLLDYELSMTGQNIPFNPYLYDTLHRELTELLLPYKIENAFHCTRLTEKEINYIETHGMQLPGRDILNFRIDKLVEVNLISEAISEKLKANNEADDKNRRGILHFVFQSPHLEGERGIGRFFTSWGGEALYNSHEGNPETGAVLSRIGCPCIIQVQIPISQLGRAFLIAKIARIYFMNRGLKTVKPIRHEDYAKQQIPPGDVVSIFRFPEKRFIELSGCQTWRDTLLTVY